MRDEEKRVAGVRSTAGRWVVTRVPGWSIYPPREPEGVRMSDNPAKPSSADDARLQADASRELARLHESLAAVTEERDGAINELEHLKSMRSALGGLASISRDLSVLIGVPAAIVAAISALNSIGLSNDAEKRMHESASSEIAARTTSANLAAATERRVRESTARELEVRALASFMSDILPRIGGGSSPRVIEQCVSARAGSIGPGVSTQQILTECTGNLPMPMSVQIGGYEAAVDLATRYPLLCRATKAALDNNAGNGDPAARTALTRLGDCPPSPRQ